MDDPLADVDLTHEHAVVNDVRLHYVAAGDPGDPLVVLLHGFPEFWYSWRYQVPALADAGYRVVAPDMRGYNRSEKPHGVDAYDTDHLAGDVAALVGHCGASEAHVVGHDWGGGVAWALAATRPASVDHLVVLNSPHPAAFARTLSLSQVRKSWYVAFFQVPWLPERVLTARDCEAVARGFTETATNPDAFDERDLDRYREAMGRPGAATSAINYYRAYTDRVGTRTALSALPLVGRFVDPPLAEVVDVPTLVLWGEQDRWLEPDFLAEIEEWVPDVTVARFPDASHWVQCDRPEAVTEELLAFLP